MKRPRSARVFVCLLSCGHRQAAGFSTSHRTCRSRCYSCYRHQRSRSNFLRQATTGGEPISWSDLALDYETRVEPVTSSFVEEILIHFRDTAASNANTGKLLDVGCGTGAGAILAARDGFAVTAIDISPAYIGRLSERCELLTNKENGLNIKCQVVDGQSLPIEWTNTFDYAVSAFSLIFFPEPKKATEEIFRCLAPGGSVVVSGWGDRGDSPAFRIVPDAIRQIAPELVASGRKDKSFLSTPQDVVDLFDEAGFVDIEVKDGVKRIMTISSPDEYYERFALGSPPTRAMISWIEQNRGNDTVQSLRETIMQFAVQRGGGRPNGPIEVVSPAFLVYARKPVFY